MTDVAYRAPSARCRRLREVIEYEIQNVCTTLMSPDRQMPDVDLATVVSLLDDEHVRSILAATSETPLSAAELSERCGVSTSSIYRRLDRLTDAGLVGERTRPRSDGHHETVYVSRLERFELTVHDGELAWDIDRESDDIADQLTNMWGKF
ncbi:Helix-turn-helix domain-containing protein [Haloplanus vescus]|uniref:Helix-turn-helix domain-containing protein n=2 Tax=Haloplanus vescus TaxID=555874 RepID=A0A1H3VU51_9EURY|nr:Helix-turn-helix domain-containing protein [Haloplanus vescus]